VTALNAVPAAYAPILRLQEILLEQRKNGLIPDTLLQLEVRRRSAPTTGAHRASLLANSLPHVLHALQHSHVYTMGKRGSSSDFLGDPSELRAGGAEVVSSPRGGETTYHGPGQLVVYPIVSLRGLGCGARAYVEGLEDVMVRTLGRYGISARVRAGE
jgi:lipoate-protein ligase B